jgi:hypothetical protein
MLVALSATVLSFSARIGGDSFTIYLNDKLMIEQHVSSDADVKNLVLNPGNARDVIKIHYNHCGKVGNSRSVALHDASANILKTWKFPDTSSPVMAFNVSEFSIWRDKRQKLYLVYSSDELPDGKRLASVMMSRRDDVSVINR